MSNREKVGSEIEIRSNDGHNNTKSRSKSNSRINSRSFIRHRVGSEGDL